MCSKKHVLHIDVDTSPLFYCKSRAQLTSVVAFSSVCVIIIIIIIIKLQLSNYW